jgi:phosphopentomutase
VGAAGAFQRTANRHDYALPPPADTLLDLLTKRGIQVVSIGKVADLFAGEVRVRCSARQTTAPASIA